MKRLLLRVLRWGALFVALLIAALVIRGLYVFRDRSPGYTPSLKLDPVSPGSEPVSLRVGFGKEKSTRTCQIPHIRYGLQDSDKTGKQPRFMMISGRLPVCWTMAIVAWASWRWMRLDFFMMK